MTTNAVYVAHALSALYRRAATPATARIRLRLVPAMEAPLPGCSVGWGSVGVSVAAGGGTTLVQLTVGRGMVLLAPGVQVGV